MIIAIMGAGNVGRALGQGWTAVGHRVVYGVRTPNTASDTNDRTTPPEAARQAEVIVLATPWTATLDMLATLGPLEDKTVIDCTNPVAFGADGVVLTNTGSPCAAEKLPQSCHARMFSKRSIKWAQM